MNTNAVIETAGWTLAHFLWQATTVALVVAVVMRGVKSASVRYLAATSAMAVLWATAGVTFGLLLPERAGPASVAAPGSAGLALERFDPDPTPSESIPAAATVPVTSSPEVAPADSTAFSEIRSASGTGVPWQTWVVALWLCGVGFFGLRFFRDWRAALVLRKTARPLGADADSKWEDRFAELSRRIRISRPVKLLTSAAVHVPAALGVLRPVVIVPVATLANLPPAQVDAVLLHELAHVRRHDFLINLLQTLAETLFFFHPAVWWISEKIREERENCCDDLASECCGDVRAYAEALAALEESRNQAALSLGMAADGGGRKRYGLLERIRRLARGDEGPRSGAGWSAIAVTGLAILGAVLVFVMMNEAKGSDGEGDSGPWATLKASRFGDDARDIFCVHTDETIQAVVVVELPESRNIISSSEAGVRRSGKKDKVYHAHAEYRWDGQRLKIEFDSKNPGRIRLNDQTVRLNFGGKVIFWRQAEQWADQSAVLAPDLPATTTMPGLRERIIETFAPDDGDRILAPRAVGKWDLGEGVTLEIEQEDPVVKPSPLAPRETRERQPDRRTTAIIRWPASEKWPALRHEIPLVNEDLGRNGKWMLGLKKGTRELWVSHPESHARIDFSDPEEIKIDWLNAAFADMPKGVLAEMQRHFRPGKRLDKAGLPHVGGNMVGDYTVSASIDEEFVIRGNVLDWRYDPPQPLGGVSIEAFLLTDDPEASASSKEDGAWELRFRLSLGAMKNGKWLNVKTNLPGMMDRDVFGEAEFAISQQGESFESKPAHVKPLAPGEPAEGVTFRMLKAGKIGGTLRDADGQPIANAYVAVKVDDAERTPPDGAMRRDGTFVRGVSTDVEGRFQLAEIPPNHRLHLTASKYGQVVQTDAYDFGDDEYTVDVTWNADDTLTCDLGKETRTDADPIILRMTQEGKISARGQEMNPAEYLRNHGLDDSDPDRPVLLSAPEDTPYHFVVEALKIFHASSNLRNISVVSEEEAEKLVESHSLGIIITIPREGKIRAGGEEMDVDDLAAYLRNVAEKSQNPDLPVNVRAPEDTPFQKVTVVLDQIKKAGLRNVSFGTTVSPLGDLPVVDPVPDPEVRLQGLPTTGDVTTIQENPAAASTKKTIATLDDLHQHIQTLVARRAAIHSAELAFTLSGTDRTSGSHMQRYDWKLDHDKFRSDRIDLPFVPGESFRETLIYSDEHQIRHLPHENDFDYVTTENRGTNPVIDPRNAGLVNWSTASLDTHDPIRSLAPLTARNWTFTEPDEHTVEARCDYGERGTGTHRVRYDRRYGLHPVFIEDRWTSNERPDESFTTTLEVEPKSFGNGLWFPAKTVWYRIDKAGREEFRQTMTLEKAVFNQPVDPHHFTVEAAKDLAGGPGVAQGETKQSMKSDDTSEPQEIDEIEYRTDGQRFEVRQIEHRDPDVLTFQVRGPDRTIKKEIVKTPWIPVEIHFDKPDSAAVTWHNLDGPDTKREERHSLYKRGDEWLLAKIGDRFVFHCAIKWKQASK